MTYPQLNQSTFAFYEDAELARGPFLSIRIPLPCSHKTFSMLTSPFSSLHYRSHGNISAPDTGHPRS